MKPNKSYKALMVEIQTAEKFKSRKAKFNLTNYLEYLMDLEDRIKKTIK